MSSTDVRPPPRLVLLRGGRDVERELSRQEADWAEFCDRIGWQSPSAAPSDAPPLDASPLEGGALEQRLIAGIERRLAQPLEGERGEACEGQGEDAPVHEPARRSRRARFGVTALAVAALLGAAAATVVSWLARPSDLPQPTRDVADGRPVAPRPLLERTPEPAPSTAPRDERVQPAPSHRAPPRLGPPRVSPPGARELARSTPSTDRPRESSKGPRPGLAPRSSHAISDDDILGIAPRFDAFDLAAADHERASSFRFRTSSPLTEPASLIGSSHGAASTFDASAPRAWLASGVPGTPVHHAENTLGAVSPAHFEASDLPVLTASALPRPTPFSLAPSRQRWIGATTPPSHADGDRRGGVGVMAQLDLGGALQL